MQQLIRLNKLVFLLICLMATTSSDNSQLVVEARSLFDHIPGANLVRDLSSTLMQTFNNVVDNSISSIGSEITALNPHIEELTKCLDSTCETLSSFTNQASPPLAPDPDAKRNVCEIIESRGFKAQEYDVITRDGYILTIQRIINPLIEEDFKNKLKPVILQHGLLSSSVDWVINSVDVRPVKFPSSSSSREGEQYNKLNEDSQKEPNSLGFYLANRGYDVFLANSRGNIYGQKHVRLSTWNPKFWDFTFDEQIKYDLPDIIDFVQHLTNQTKVGYVGHSQGTTMIFGLLADQPDYAEIVEPVVALAPVAYVNNCLSPVKYLSIYTPIAQHINMWFGSSNVAIRYLAPKVCGPKVVRKELCANIIFLSCGFDEQQFNETRINAYLAHMPSGTSVKNIAHWGQEVNSGKFAHFDHGILANQIKYGQPQAPDYDLSKIKSKSMALFTAENDWLASPKDVARLKAELTVPLFKAVNVSESNPKWNHIDFVYGKDCGRLVNSEILNIFDHFNENIK